MAIKDKVLELLDDNKGKYLSGEQLADAGLHPRGCLESCESFAGKRLPYLCGDEQGLFP